MRREKIARSVFPEEVRKADGYILRRPELWKYDNESPRPRILSRLRIANSSMHSYTKSTDESAGEMLASARLIA